MSHSRARAVATWPNWQRATCQLCARTPPRLDILVNNVGTNIRKAATDFTESEYEALLATNLGSAFHLSRAAYAHLALSLIHI